MKTLAASTSKNAFDLKTESVLESPIDAVELTDEDLEQVTGSCWGGCGWGGGFSPGWGWGGGFSPFWGGGFGPSWGWGGGFGRSFAFSGFNGAFAGTGW